MSPKKILSKFTFVFVMALIAAGLGAGAAAAVGGGGAEPMPMTSFTAMPSYHPKPVGCLRWGRCVGKHARWQPTSRYYD